MQSIDLRGRNGSSGAITIYHRAADFGRYFFRRRVIDPRPRALSSLAQTRGFASFLPPGEIDAGEAQNPLILINTTYFILPPLPLPIAKGTFEATDPRKHPEQNTHT